jgi:hypothetical protein
LCVFYMHSRCSFLSFLCFQKLFQFICIFRRSLKSLYF